MLLKIHILVGLLIISGKSTSYPLVNQTTDIETTERDQLKDEGSPQTSTEDLLPTTTDELEVNNETIFTYVTNVSNDFTTRFPNNVEEDSANICIFEVDKDDIRKKKQEMHSLTALDGQGYLFFIHLELPFIDKMIVNVSEKYQIINSLLEWQFVHKEEKFLVQLPVDFELITFDVLKYVKEESDITVLLNVNNSECTITDENKDMTIAKLRNYLWKEIFVDFTNYLLCHRHFIPNDYRTYLYYVTTIWKGYDLICYPSTLETGPILLNKDELVNIAPLLCYFLSLQFVLIFAILRKHRTDKKHRSASTSNNNASTESQQSGPSNNNASTESQQSGPSNNNASTESQQSGPSNNNASIESQQSGPSNSNASTNNGSTESQQSGPCNKNASTESQQFGPSNNNASTNNGSTESQQSGQSHNNELTFNYRGRDRPYGFKRVLMKIFYSRFSEIEFKTSSKNCNDNCNKFWNKIHAWIYNLPSFRLMFLTYILILLPFGVYRTFYRKIISDISHNDYKNVIRTNEPLFYKMIQDEETAFHADAVFATIFPLISVFFCTAQFEYNMSQDKGDTSSNGIGYESIAHFINFKNAFTELFNIYCICFNFFSNRCPCKRKRNNAKNKTTKRHRCCNPAKCDIAVCKCCNKSLTYDKNKQCCIGEECKCNENCKCKKEKKNICLAFMALHFKLIWYFLNVILPIISFVVLPLTHNPFTDRKNEKKIGLWIYRVMKPLIILLYIFSAFIVLRPMITTFTFVLRSLTYLLFVAMPVRIALFRYFLIASTTLFYFYKYYVDILTMFSKILSHIFKLSKKSVEDDEIDEGTFTFIVCNLFFVKKKIYYFIFKCMVVLMYLSITMGTVLISGKSTIGLHFSEIMEVAFILVSPYAFEIFMTSKDEEKLTPGNKKDIENQYKDFREMEEKINSIRK